MASKKSALLPPHTTNPVGREGGKQHSKCRPPLFVELEQNPTRAVSNLLK